jgi:hypothetical protein
MVRAKIFENGDGGAGSIDLPMIFWCNLFFANFWPLIFSEYHRIFASILSKFLT